MKKTVQINYFALFREQRGLAEETVETGADTVGQLYEELQKRHRFTLPKNSLRAALNDEFCQWECALKAGDRIVFIPPVAGG
ncbi:MAG: MoaD/ThiS family protein [Candidatus Obscuribacterales bacterium]|jgi:molybdopterin synthase sulfur carrier subunit|nr:MoaD/ThiS family protein [Candidatus Obscuribacterales bacterium]